MLAKESGDLGQESECAAQLKLSKLEVAEAFWQAMQWARAVSAE
jgi:hypothetical protein